MTGRLQQLHKDDGFTLVEVFAAMMLVVIGLMALVGSVAVGTRRITGSQDQLIASQRAAEAVESVFKARPAPGAFTFALSEGLVIQTGLIHGTGMSYLGGEIRVVAPVVVDDTIRVAVTIAEKRETRKADRGIVTHQHTVTNQRGEVVLEAVIKRMIRRRAA